MRYFLFIILFMCLALANISIAQRRAPSPYTKNPPPVYIVPELKNSIPPSYSQSSANSYSGHNSPVWVKSSSSSRGSSLSYDGENSGSSSQHSYSSAKPKCHTINKLVCNDIEIEDSEYQIDSECETKNVEKCFTVPEAKVDQQQIEKCEGISTGFRRVETYTDTNVCVDYTETVCKSVVTNEEISMTKTECNNICTESCSQTSRLECADNSEEVPTKEYIRECTKQLVTQCKDDCRDCGHYSNSMLVNCTSGADGRELCPTPQVCKDEYLEKCEQKLISTTKTVSECRCQDVLVNKCVPESTKVCNDVEVIETTPMVEEHCQDEEKTSCQMKGVPTVDFVADDGCIGRDSQDPGCYTVSQTLCFTVEKDVVVYDREREECVTVPCEECHERLVEVPTVRTESECHQEPTEVCEPTLTPYNLQGE